MKPDRRTFIGGSDAAAILGLSPWATPLNIFRRKRGEVPDDFEIDPWKAKILKRGKRMEPIVVDMLIDELAIKVTKRSTDAKPNRYAFAKPDDFMAAEVDFEWEVQQADIDRWNLPPELLGTTQNGEVKTVHPFGSKKYGEEGTDEIPIEYAIQAMHGLMVTGRAITLFAVLVGSDNLLTYIVRRDDDTIVTMRERERVFWHQHVKTGVPPEPQNLFDIITLFDRRKATKVQASPEVAALVTELIGKSSEVSSLEDQVEELKFRIGRFMLGELAIGRKVKNKKGALGKVEPLPGAEPGTHVLRLGDRDILTVALQSRDGVDMTKLRAEFADAARACSKSSQFFVFRPKRT